jgi:hypothetical protein
MCCWNSLLFTDTLCNVIPQESINYQISSLHHILSWQQPVFIFPCWKPDIQTTHSCCTQKWVILHSNFEELVTYWIREKEELTVVAVPSISSFPKCFIFSFHIIAESYNSTVVILCFPFIFSLKNRLNCSL